MPIRPENRDRYPADWPAISLRVREESGQKCEFCTAPNATMIRRGRAADGRAVWRHATDSAHMNGFYDDGTEAPDSDEDICTYSNPVRVVLTVAHLDHKPENCDRANLRALCQRCHNVYDAPMRRAGIRHRQREAMAVAELFVDPPHPERT